MMYGCGAIVDSLIAKPYIFGDLSNQTAITDSAIDVTTLGTTTSFQRNKIIYYDINYSVDRRSNFEVL